MFLVEERCSFSCFLLKVPLKNRVICLASSLSRKAHQKAGEISHRKEGKMRRSEGSTGVCVPGSGVKGVVWGAGVCVVRVCGMCVCVLGFGVKGVVWGIGVCVVRVCGVCVCVPGFGC